MLNPEQTTIHRQAVTRMANRTSSQSSIRDKKLMIWAYVLAAEIEMGTRFLVTDPEGHLFIVLAATKQILPISRAGMGAGKLTAYLNAMYGLSERDTLAQFVADNIRAYGTTEGVRVELRRFSAYEAKSRTAYLSGYNGYMWKMDGTNAVSVDNGDSEIFFADDDGGQPIAPDIGEHGLLLDRLMDLNYVEGLGGITPAQQRMALTIWLFALAFPDLMPTKPLLILEGTQGSGKCLGRGTPVLYADGSVRPAEQVQLGDRLMGPDGTARNVLSTTIGHGPLYRVVPIKGEPWVCNDAHILTLACSDDEEVRDIPLEDFAGWKPWKQNRFKQFSVGIDHFEGEGSFPIDPYFLGVWFGDGTKEISKLGLVKVSISKPDQEIIDLCEATAARWGLTVTEYRYRGETCPTFSLISDERNGQHVKNKLLDTMRDLLGRDLIIPDSYLRGPREVRLQLLAGLLDSDGHLASGCFEIAQKREDWARAVWWLARSVGLCATIAPKIGRCQNGFEGQYWRVMISGNTDQIPTRIPRKQASARQQIKDATRTGITVEPIGDGEYFGFVIDGDRRFLLGDFTVTHNTAAVVLTQIALMGRKKPISINRNKEDSFGILLLRSPITLFDNTDSYIDWIADAVCTYCTSGQFPRRKLYSDDEEIIIKPHAFIAVASKNPSSFRREDVVDRTIVIRLDRRPDFTSMRKLEAEVVEIRDKLFGEYLWFVNKLVAEIRAGALEESETETHRMADFAAFGRVVARVVGWSVDDVRDLMTALQGERDAFTAEEDPLLELLHDWISYKPRLGGTNIGRAVSITSLFQELETIAQARGTEKSYYKTPRILAQKIRSQHVLRDFDVEVGALNNCRIYRIFRKTDPRLVVIEGGLASDEESEAEA